MSPLVAAPLWSMKRATSPVIATAIHDGGFVRPSLEPFFAVSQQQRLREEDPHTGFIIGSVPNQIICHRSRFEVDLNRARSEAIYLRPEQAWGLNIWQGPLHDHEIAISRGLYDDYYEMLLAALRGMERTHSRFVVFDVHSYNHQREAPGRLTDQKQAPDINIGTFSMDREQWAFVVDPLIAHFRSFSFDGRRLDVRENVAFQGKGEQTRFIHEHFPETGCAIAIEFKKIFMDEWTGEPNEAALWDLRNAVTSAVPLIETLLERHV